MAEADDRASTFRGVNPKPRADNAVAAGVVTPPPRQGGQANPEAGPAAQSGAGAFDGVTQAATPGPTQAPTQANDPGTPVFAVGPAPTAAATTAPPGSRFIGAYRLVRTLGEGGMGQVWLAEQTAPLRREVALKLIRAGMYDSAMLQRFQSERQSLALMNHPSIAKVFDAGATSDGQPYYVMEYVPGQPITDYCDQKHLSIRERLELFVQLCEGVQHAHQKAIIHRDLKPANILVVGVDGKPTPRIIDFGLAKAVGPLPFGESMFTQVGGFVGTPGYMSPEQGDFAGQDVDTRTDVYSLGIILYELLTGTLPFDPKRWHKLPMNEVLRQLREDDPQRPSTQVNKKAATEKEAASAIFEARRTDSRQLVSLLRGDLDWIVMKAIEKDRTRRYGSASDLAADIRRHLDYEPVLARPASLGYRARKYVRRHRLAVAAAAVIAVTLATGGVMQALTLRRVTRERDRANRITEFMTRMFKVSDPSEARGNSITAREVLDRASKDIDRGLSKDPELQAQMAQTMGNVYESLGLYARAETLDREALGVRTHALGAGNADTIDSMSQLSNVLKTETKYPESEKLARDSYDLARKKFGPSAKVSLDSAILLGNVLNAEGRYSDSETVFRQALLDIGKNKNVDDKTNVVLEGDLAINLAYQGKYPDAEKSFRHVYEIDKKLYGDDSPATLHAESNLGSILLQERKFPEADSTYRQAIEGERRVLGPEHPQTLNTMGNLAMSLKTQTKYAEAEPLERQIFEAKTRVLGPDNRSTLVSEGDLADLLRMEAHYPEAEKVARQTLEGERRVLGPEHSDTLISMNTLGQILIAERQYPQADATMEQLLRAQTKVLGADHPDTLVTAGYLALLRVREHHYAEGEAALRGTVAQCTKVFTAHSQRTAAAEANLAAGLAIEAKRDEAFAHLQAFLDDGPGPDMLQDMTTTDDLSSLHSDPRWKSLAERATQIMAQAKKQ